MEIGIVGLPKSGKTTVFNALTRSSAEVTAYGAAQTKPNIGVAKVHDQRLDLMEAIFNPRRKAPGEVAYVDVPAAPGRRGETSGIAGELLNHLQRTDALLVVVRAFEDPSVRSPGGSVDPLRDAEAALYDLAFADLDILVNRLARLDELSKGAKAPERDAIGRERDLLSRLKDGLEAGTPVSGQTLSSDERRVLEGFQLLTAKPRVVVLNIGENQLTADDSLDERLPPELADARTRVTAMCAKLEMELTQMEPEDEREFRESLGLKGLSVDDLVRLSLEALDRIAFFTGNANEVRAWIIPRGTPASRAAGAIHSDFERGFIRAEVIGVDDLERCGSIAEARSQGLLRQEGKGYVIQDGDVVNVLFNR